MMRWVRAVAFVCLCAASRRAGMEFKAIMYYIGSMLHR